MKIRTQAGILICLVTIVPSLFLSMIGYIEYGFRRKISKSIYLTVEDVYRCLEKDDWAGFVPDSYVLNAFNILSVEIKSENRDTLVIKYISEQEILEKNIRGITDYVITLSEIEKKYEKRLSRLSGFGKFDVIFSIKMPMDSLIRPRDNLKKIIDIGVRVIIVGVIIFAIFLIITLSRMSHMMQKVLKGWEENDFMVDLPPASNDEITELVKTFNNAGRKIHENYALRDRFIMGLSHDFKTPLALIHGYSELLQKQIPLENEKAHKNLLCIETNADQLDIMISELLDFVALESGDLPFCFEENNFTNWLKSIVLRAGNEALLLGKEVKDNIRLEENIFVKMDVRLCERAIVNLIQNGIRYTGSDGQVVIGAEISDGIIKVSVMDNGAGISKKDLPHVFDLFYRASPERDKKGMGIGLSTVKTVVSGHGWNVKAENIKPHGACFTIEIPSFTRKL